MKSERDKEHARGHRGIPTRRRSSREFFVCPASAKQIGNALADALAKESAAEMPSRPKANRDRDRQMTTAESKESDEVRQGRAGEVSEVEARRCAALERRSDQGPAGHAGPDEGAARPQGRSSRSARRHSPARPRRSSRPAKSAKFRSRVSPRRTT